MFLQISSFRLCGRVQCPVWGSLLLSGSPITFELCLQEFSRWYLCITFSECQTEGMPAVWKAESCRRKKIQHSQALIELAGMKIPVRDVGYHLGSYELCLLGWAFCFQLCELFLKSGCFMNHMTLLLHTMFSMHPPYSNQTDDQVMMIKWW